MVYKSVVRKSILDINNHVDCISSYTESDRKPLLDLISLT